MYNFGYGRAQGNAHQRIRDEWDGFEIANIETPLVNYELPDVSAALHEVMGLCVYDQRTDLWQLHGFENPLKAWRIITIGKDFKGVEIG